MVGGSLYVIIVVGSFGCYVSVTFTAAALLTLISVMCTNEVMVVNSIAQHQGRWVMRNKLSTNGGFTVYHC